MFRSSNLLFTNRHTSLFQNRYFAQNAGMGKIDPLLLKVRLNLRQKNPLEPHEEFDRLISNQMICERLSYLDLYHLNEFQLPSIMHKIAFGRSLKIFELFNQTHYVLHHSQSIDFLMLNILTKLVLCRNQPDALSEFETVMRHPMCFDAAHVETYTVDVFKNNITWDNISNENDHYYTKYLIAADAYLASVAHGESALRYFTEDWNYKSFIKDQSLLAIVNYCIADESIKKKFISKFYEIEKKAKIGKGILYTICIPKDYFNECAYLSEMLGIPSDILAEDVHLTLNMMQAECRPNKLFPQVRLLAHKLNSEKVKTFIFPAMQDQLYFQLIQDMQSLIDENYSYLNTGLLGISSEEKRYSLARCE